MKVLSQLFRRDGPTAIALLVLLTAIAFTPGRLHSQTAANTGQILGQVLDPSGAAVPNAEVSIRNRDTNQTRIVTSDVKGRYVIPFVPLGFYDVTVTSSGFGAAATQQVFITLGSSIAANFSLSMDAVRETIDVAAEPIRMEAASSTSDSAKADRSHELPASRSRSSCSAWATRFALLAFRASLSAVSKSFRASSLSPNAYFATPRL